MSTTQAQTHKPLTYSEMVVEHFRLGLTETWTLHIIRELFPDEVNTARQLYQHLVDLQRLDDSSLDQAIGRYKEQQ